jgi:hypothetical protein
MGIKAVSGRLFSAEFSADSIASFILNETACKGLNITDPVGEMITWEDLARSLRYLEKTWKQFEPGQDFKYSFLDDDFTKLYEAEEKNGSHFQDFHPPGNCHCMPWPAGTFILCSRAANQGDLYQECARPNKQADFQLAGQGCCIPDSYCQPDRLAGRRLAL